MPVLAVGANLFSPNKQQKNYTNSVLNTCKPIDIHENNNLIDMNYGRSLVKGNEITFKGSSPEVIDLTKKVSSAFGVLSDKDVLLVGKSFEEAKECLKGSIGLFKDLIKSILFIEDPQLKTTIALRTGKDGIDEIINLKDPLIFIKHLTDTQIFSLKKGEVSVLEDGDYISTRRPEYGFSIDFGENTESFDNLPKGAVQLFDLTKANERSVSEINAKNLTRLSEVERSPKRIITFADVGGQEEAIAEIKTKLLYPIRYPNFFSNSKLSGIHSALFIGPPGNGKTLAAEAFGNEAGITFLNVSGQLLEGPLVGASAHNIHDYYELAKRIQPCILFFDEIDAILGKRTGGVHRYADQSVNMHLDEMSKLEKEGADIFLLGATNHPELMDEAALRNGRLGTKIEFKNPDTVEKCKTIFGIHSNGLNIQGLNVDEFARKLLKADFSGADIASVVKEAIMQSIERQGIFKAMDNWTFKDDPSFKFIVTEQDFNTALEKLSSQMKLVAKYSKTKRVRGFADEEK